MKPLHYLLFDTEETYFAVFSCEIEYEAFPVTISSIPSLVSTVERGVACEDMVPVLHNLAQFIQTFAPARLASH